MKLLLRRCAGPLLFLLIWAVILGVPRLRLVMFTHAGSDETLAKLAPYTLPLAKIFAPREASPESLAARYPDDVRVQAWAAGSEGDFENARKLEPVMRRFPREAWLRANYLRFLTSPLQTGRVAGTFESSGGPIPPEKAPNLSKAELERAVAVAQEGAKLEPDNCFFDMMRALFLFALRRDDEALQALRDGGHKKRFDDHLTEDTRFRIEVQELENPLVFEQRLSLWAASLLPHLSKARLVAYLAMWRALQREQKGDWQSALEIRASVMRLGARMRDNDGSLLVSLVGVAIEDIAWKSNSTKLPVNRTGKSVTLGRLWAQQTQLWSQHFIALCRAHNRPDLATETAREAAATLRFYDWRHNNLAAPTGVYGVPDRLLAQLGVTNWLGVALLFQIALMLPVWGVLALILWLKRAPGEEKRPGAVFLVCGATLFICGSAIFIALRVVDGISGGWNNFFWGNSNSQVAIIEALRWVVTLAPLLGGALFCAIATWWKHRKILREADRAAQNDPLRLAPALRVWITRLLLLLTLVSVVYAIYALSNGLAPATAAMPSFWVEPLDFLSFIASTPYLSLYAVLVLLSWWVFSSLWLLPKAALPVAGSGLKWLRQSLGATLLLSSGVYLAVLLVSLQARTQVDTAFDSVLRRGEMATLRQLATQNRNAK